MSMSINYVETVLLFKVMVEIDQAVPSISEIVNKAREN
jgi:hypothetical protein